MLLSLIYLPYENFQQSVSCYSDDLLRCMLDTLWSVRHDLKKVNPYDVNCRNRYIWRGWHNWPEAYTRFHLICFEEAKQRGLDFDTGRLEIIKRSSAGGRFIKPQWVGWEQLHSNHRANLLHLGVCEVLASRICAGYSREPAMDDPYVSRWLGECGFPGNTANLEDCSIAEITHILDIDEFPSPTIENPYTKFGWSEEATQHCKFLPLEPSESYLC